MAKKDIPGDDPDAVRRFDETLLRLVSTPPKSHDQMKKVPAKSKTPRRED